MREILFFALCILPGVSLSQSCSNSITPSCDIYTSCFAYYCNCDSSPYEYYKSYGAKYCDTFLELGTLSTAGVKWRNATLVCLQEKTIPSLEIQEPPAACDCKKTQLVAFENHVACYTQAGSSICDLPRNDWKAIFDAAGGIQTLVDQNSRKQLLEVANICIPILSERTRSATSQAAKDVQQAILKQIQDVKNLLE